MLKGRAGALGVAISVVATVEVVPIGVEAARIGGVAVRIGEAVVRIGVGERPPMTDRAVLWAALAFSVFSCFFSDSSFSP